MGVVVVMVGLMLLVVMVMMMVHCEGNIGAVVVVLICE